MAGKGLSLHDTKKFLQISIDGSNIQSLVAT